MDTNYATARPGFSSDMMIVEQKHSGGQRKVTQHTAQKAQHIYKRKTDGRTMDEDMSKYEPPWWKCQ
jgi:hypothetical protein